MNIYEQIKTAIAQDYYQMNYPNDGQRFVAWYLRNIHHLETFEAKDCITDGANDRQIDAVYIDEQEEIVYVIQGKFHESTTIDAGPLREMVSAALMLQDLALLQIVDTSLPCVAATRPNTALALWRRARPAGHPAARIAA